MTQLQKARANLRKSIIAERRAPTLHNPARVSWLARLRKSVLRRAVKQGA